MEKTNSIIFEYDENIVITRSNNDSKKEIDSKKEDDSKKEIDQKKDNNSSKSFFKDSMNEDPFFFF